MTTRIYEDCWERDVERKPIGFLIWIAILFVLLSLALAGSSYAQEKSTSAEEEGKLIIKSRSGASLTISKGDFSRGNANRGESFRRSQRATPTAIAPVPTSLKLNFNTLVAPGDTVKGSLKFNDPDDYVLSIFITVFFPDGDVVTESLYDVRIDGGDVWKGNYSFWIEIPESETPLPGRIIITATDDYLNVSEVSQNFVLDY